MQVPPESLERRFERLRKLVLAWEIRYNQLPDQVMSLFDASDLSSIADLLAEKRQLQHLIPSVTDFIRRWEAAAGEEPVASSARSSVLESEWD
ncbi:MAG: hypothetical protein ACXVDB_04730 [Tumebacillaceae bacterium]